MAAHILVIDDDPLICALISDALRDKGFRVQTAANGLEGLQSIEQSLPSLILLDMWMPELDGWGFARVLRAREISIPIIVMTAAQDPYYWAREVNAAGHIHKPFDLAELFDTVGQMLA
jgi:CheY-like chemotaxis protein